MRTLPTDAAAQIAAAYRKPVAIAHLTASEPGRADTVYRWASRALTLSGQTYTDAFSRKPALGWRTTQPHGGLFREGDCTLYLRNETGLAPEILSDYYPGGDAVEVFLLFLTGSETAASLVRIFQGIAGEPEYDGQQWQLRCVGDAESDFRELPVQRVNNKSHPLAQRDAIGKPIPYVLGHWSAGELIDEAYAIDLMPLLLVDQFSGVYQGGTRMADQAAFYLQYPQADKLALVRGSAYTGDPVAGTRTLTSTERTVYLYPALPQSTNTVTNWYRTANRVLTSGASLSNGATLDVFMEEVPRLGEATAATLEILVQANAVEYDVVVRRFNEIVFQSAGLTGDLIVPLIGIDGTTTTISGTQTFNSDRTDSGVVEIESGTTITVADGVTWTIEKGEDTFGDSWGGWKVELTGHGVKQIYQIAIPVHFFEQQSGDLTSLKAFGQGVGRTGGTSLTDGAAITTGPLEKGVDQLHYTLRAQDGFGLSESRVDTASFAAAAANTRRYWRTKVGLTRAEEPHRLMDEFAYLLGGHLIFTLDNDWRFVARDLAADPVHIFRRTNLVARRVNPQTGQITQPGPDARTGQLNSRDALNDLSIRYGQYPPTDDYQAVVDQTARWWASGTASVASQTLTDPTADFIAAQIAVGHTVVMGHQAHTVTAVTTTTLGVSPGGGHQTAIAYWVGPGLSVALVHSRRRYGGRENTLTRAGAGGRDGGLTTRYVDFDLRQDAEERRTAERFAEYGAQWFSQAWALQELASFMATLALELGDVVLLDDSDLPAPLRIRAHGAVAEAIDAAEVVWDVGTGNGPGYQVGEWLLIDDEVVKVTATAADTITVDRNKAGTAVTTHDSGTTLYLCPVKWEIAGIQPNLETWTLRYRLQQMPAHVESYWLEDTTRTTSADEYVWGSLVIGDGEALTVGNGQTLTLLDAP